MISTSYDIFCFDYFETLTSILDGNNFRVPIAKLVGKD